MKGKYAITVRDNALQYRFEIRRNITVIKGDKPCVVLEGRQWKLLLENIHDSIVFIDEGNQFIATDEFAKSVKTFS